MLDNTAIRQDSFKALRSSWLPALLISALYTILLTGAGLLGGGWRYLQNMIAILDLIEEGSVLEIGALQQQNYTLDMASRFLSGAFTILLSPYLIYSFQALYRPNSTLDLRVTPSDSGWARPGHSPSLRMNMRYGWQAWMDTGSARTLQLMLQRQITLFLLNLLVIPGIIKYYAYTLAPYLLRDDPELTPSDALAVSSSWTYGYKMSLFGSEILIQLPLIIVTLTGIAAASSLIQNGWPANTILLIVGLLFTLVSIFTQARLSSYHALFYEAVRAERASMQQGLSRP